MTRGDGGGVHGDGFGGGTGGGSTDGDGYGDGNGLLSTGDRGPSVDDLYTHEFDGDGTSPARGDGDPHWWGNV